jgi:hypothetical protein
MPSELQKITTRTIMYSASGNSPEHDRLPLPDTERTVGETDTETLRGIFAKFGIDNAWTEGRASLVSKWAKFIGEVYAEAGQAAVSKLLTERRRYE